MSKILLSLAALCSFTNSFCHQEPSESEDSYNYTYTCPEIDDTTLKNFKDVQIELDLLRAEVARATKSETTVDKERELGQFFYRCLEAHANIYLNSVRSEIFNQAVYSLVVSHDLSLRDKLMVCLGLKLNYLSAKIKSAQDITQAEQIKIFEERSLGILDEFIVELNNQIAALEQEIAQLEKEIEEEENAAANESAHTTIAETTSTLDQPVTKTDVN